MTSLNDIKVNKIDISMLITHYNKKSAILRGILNLDAQTESGSNDTLKTGSGCATLIRIRMRNPDIKYLCTSLRVASQGPLGRTDIWIFLHLLFIRLFRLSNLSHLEQVS